MGLSIGGRGGQEAEQEGKRGKAVDIGGSSRRWRLRCSFPMAPGDGGGDDGVAGQRRSLWGGVGMGVVARERRRVRIRANYVLILTLH